MLPAFLFEPSSHLPQICPLQMILMQGSVAEHDDRLNGVDVVTAIEL